MATVQIFDVMFKKFNALSKKNISKKKKERMMMVTTTTSSDSELSWIQVHEHLRQSTLLASLYFANGFTKILHTLIHT
jgi:hypothetical protein